jgi:sec-independent protein translocase protein TatC
MAEAEHQDDPGMTLGDHLAELRTRLFRGVIVILVCFIGAWIMRDEVKVIVEGPFKQSITWLNEDWTKAVEEMIAEDPDAPRTDYYLSADPTDMRLLQKYVVSDVPIVTKPFEYIMNDLKSCLYFALFIGGPYLLWQIWGFIGAGLYKSERSVVLSFFPISIILFFAGVAFGYTTLVPYGFYYLNGDMMPGTVLPAFRLEDYFTFISSLCLALGVVFQLPVLQTAVAKVGLVDPKTFSHYRGHFALASFVIAAMLTPPDPYTQTMMAGPMIILYEIGTISARFVAPKPLAIDDGEAE